MARRIQRSQNKPGRVSQIVIHPNVRIDQRELHFQFDRSEGPGGQNVNKVATRAKLLFDLAGTGALTPEQKTRVRAALATRISRDGMLQIVCGKHRTQSANRREAIARFAALMGDALRIKRVRKATRPSAGSKKRRLDAKRRQSEKKQFRTRQAWSAE